MWYFTKLAMKQRALTILIALALTAGSIWATFQLKLEFIPDIEMPFIMAITAYPDATPDEVAADVTGPIQNVIWDRWDGDGLRHVYSTSADGISVVFAEFDFGTDMQRVRDSIKEDIAPGALELPLVVRALPAMDPRVDENPQIVDLDPSMMPLVVFSLTGDVPAEQLGVIAETQIVPELLKVKGIRAAEIDGGEKEQVLISPDPELMSQSGVSMSGILGLLRQKPEYDSLGAVENLVLGPAGVVLGEVADVTLGPAPGTRISRTDGQPSVGIAVIKAKDANTVEVANAVVERAEELSAGLGNGLEFQPAFDQSDFIEDSISDLTNMALVGAALAIIIVFVFLAAFRASLVTAASIPLSILIGFLAMYASGITINMLTLSAMAIAVGRLIDNSIVVTEVTYRRMKAGEGFLEASINGAKEIAGPITSSTLATVAIFIPLMFVGGIVGQLFVPFALTMTYALVASLFVALMVVPAFSRWFMGGGVKGKDEDKPARDVDSWYVKLYMPSLRWALGHRILTLVVAGALFVGSLGLIPVIGTSFLPEMPMSLLVVEIEMPPGTEIGETIEVAKGVEKLLVGRDNVDLVFTHVGTTTTSVHAAVSVAMGGGDNTAEINVLLDPDADQDKVLETLDAAVQDLPFAEYVTVLSGEEAQGSQMGFGGALEVNVRGESADNVKLAAEMLLGRLAEIEAIDNLESDLSRVVPRLDIRVDSGKIAALGLTQQQELQVWQEKSLLEMGAPVADTVVNVDGDSYGVFVKGVAMGVFLTENPEATARALRLEVGSSLTLDDVAEVALDTRPTHVGHIDLELAASITGKITEKNVGSVNSRIQKEMDAVEVDLAALGITDVEIEMGGVAEQMAESFEKMGIAIVIAMVIAYLILVLSMRSVLNPVIIMVSLPLASIGALVGLLAGGYTIGMSGMMGMLMLVGIVLTNAIVLIALVEQLKKQGAATHDALIEGGRTRLRPILMTALTTMFAMLPLAFGLGAGTLLAAELAVVVIGGLFSSTLLTLLVIPVIYSLADGVRQRRAGSR